MVHVVQQGTGMITTATKTVVFLHEIFTIICALKVGMPEILNCLVRAGCGSDCPSHKGCLNGRICMCCVFGGCSPVSESHDFPVLWICKCSAACGLCILHMGKVTLCTSNFHSNLIISPSRFMILVYYITFMTLKRRVVYC